MSDIEGVYTVGPTVGLDLIDEQELISYLEQEGFDTANLEAGDPLKMLKAIWRWIGDKLGDMQ